jgi:hypothetical protein
VVVGTAVVEKLCPLALFSRSHSWLPVTMLVDQVEFHGLNDFLHQTCSTNDHNNHYGCHLLPTHTKRVEGNKLVRTSNSQRRRACNVHIKLDSYCRPW